MENKKEESAPCTWTQSKPDKFNNVTVTIIEGDNKVEVILERFTKKGIELINSSSRLFTETRQDIIQH